MKKRLLSLLFVFALSIFALISCGGENPPPENPEPDPTGLEFTLKEDGSYAVSVGTLSDAEDIEIPAEYNGKRVTEIAEHGFRDIAAKSITIPANVKVIGASAFRGCQNLTKIELPTMLESIGAHAFYNCKSLSSVLMNARLKSIGAYAFYGCNQISAVSFPTRLSEIGEGAFFAPGFAAVVTFDQNYS